MEINERETTILHNLLKRSELKSMPEWLKEIRHMLKYGLKIEIEAFYDARGYLFLVDHYLRYKLNNEIWI